MRFLHNIFCLILCIFLCIPIFCADDYLIDSIYSESQSAVVPEIIEPLIDAPHKTDVPKKTESSHKSTKKQKLSIDLPENNKLIQKYRKEYTSAFGKKWLYNIMKNAEPYRLYIRSEIQKRNMPEFLEYLPVVESSYSIKAVSKSGATGLWQFMENSIKPYMHKNQWIDERYDPWVATRAALSKLQDNYKTLGTWELALAAYNYGLGGITRIIKQNPNKDYWQLSEEGLLRTETKNYVPRLLVIADLIINSQHYEIDLPILNSKDYHAFSEITVNDCYDINLIAQKADIPLQTLIFFNPALKYNITPPNIDYKLRIPKEKLSEVKTALMSITPQQAQLYTVKKGDTLWSISRKYNVDIEELCRINKIQQNGILSIGKVLKLPINNR